VTRIDHVLFAVRDFAESTARLSAEFGLAAVEGGRHTGWGTANWIVPLGTSYLELIGVVDRATANANPFGRRVQQVIADGGGPFAWCVTPADFDGTVARLGLEAGSGSRQRPDGATVSWRMAGLDVALADPSRAFFLDWKVAPQDHPGRAFAAHRVQPEGIAWVEIQGDETAIRAWLGDDDLQVHVRPGPPAVLSVGIAAREGEIVLP
jgi:catechol 2,3-dioxygenase-like lactoylglutathione lyase family enzyme